MGRYPDPESKTLRLVLEGESGESEKIRAVKEICKRNDITIHDVLMKHGVNHFLRLHHWPPGNSQSVLESYGVEKKRECYLCHELKPKLVKVEFISGLQKSICPECLRADKEDRRLVKKVLL